MSRPPSPEVFALDIAFARLELLELEHGRRKLTQCPGLKAMARHVAEAEKRASDEAHAENFGGSPHA